VPWGTVTASDGGEMNWTDTWRDAFRTELRTEAIGFARHGWPVVPGSYPRGSHWVGMPSSRRTGARCGASALRLGATGGLRS
jgi:hypothetical protein